MCINEVYVSLVFLMVFNRSCLQLLPVTWIYIVYFQVIPLVSQNASQNLETPTASGFVHYTLVLARIELIAERVVARMDGGLYTVGSS